MSILQEFENMKYRCVLDLIKNEEAYDKKRAVINGLDAFKLCHNRYLLMQQILIPLKHKLGERVEITDISFANGMQDDFSILIKYAKDGKNYLFTLANQDYEDISIVSSDLTLQKENFAKDNKRIIMKTFKDIDNNSLDEDITLTSTTGKFVIRDNCDSFLIQDSAKKIFSIEGKYSVYEKSGALFDSSKINCNYPKLKEMLSDCWNGVAIYEHLHIYKDNVPKQLTKKLTHR